MLLLPQSQDCILSGALRTVLASSVPPSLCLSVVMAGPNIDPGFCFSEGSCGGGVDEGVGAGLHFPLENIGVRREEEFQICM